MSQSDDAVQAEYETALVDECIDHVWTCIRRAAERVRHVDHTCRYREVNK